MLLHLEILEERGLKIGIIKMMKKGIFKHTKAPSSKQLFSALLPGALGFVAYEYSKDIVETNFEI